MFFPAAVMRYLLRWFLSDLSKIKVRDRTGTISFSSSFSFSKRGNNSINTRGKLRPLTRTDGKNSACTIQDVPLVTCRVVLSMNTFCRLSQHEEWVVVHVLLLFFLVRTDGSRRCPSVFSMNADNVAQYWNFAGWFWRGTERFGQLQPTSPDIPIHNDFVCTKKLFRLHATL